MAAPLSFPVVLRTHRWRCLRDIEWIMADVAGQCPEMTKYMDRPVHYALDRDEYRLLQLHRNYARWLYPTYPWESARCLFEGNEVVWSEDADRYVNPC